MEDLKNSYLNEQGLRQERDALRAQVAELRGATEAMRAKCEAIALGWADLDCRPDANVMAIQIANAIAALPLPSASEQSGGVK